MVLKAPSQVGAFFVLKSIKHTLKLLSDLYAELLEFRVSYGGKPCNKGP